MGSVSKAVILATGPGKRLRPLTYGVPRELLIINNKPLIHYSLEECVAARVKEAAVIVNEHKPGIRNYLEKVFKDQIRLKFILQSKPAGIAAAVLIAEDFLAPDPFFLILPEIVFSGGKNPLLELNRCYQKYKAPCSIIQWKDENCQHNLTDQMYTENIYRCDNLFFRINRSDNGKSIQKNRYKMVGRAIWDSSLLCYLKTSNDEDSLEDYLETIAIKKYFSEREYYGVFVKSYGFDCSTLKGYNLAQAKFQENFCGKIPQNKDVEISVIIAVYNEEKVLDALYNRLISVLQVITKKYEIIFIDDGSKDSSWNIIENLNRKNFNVKGIKFSRNFGQHAALTAGLDIARGDFIVMMDADLQDQPEDIPVLLDKFKSGCDIVYALRKSRSDLSFKEILSRTFFSLFNKLSPLNISPNVGTYRIITRLVRDQIVTMREQKRLITGLIDWLGFDAEYVEVDRSARYDGETKYTIKRSFKLAFEAIMSFSNLPLRFATFLGFGMSAFSIILGVFFLTKKIFYDIDVSGWPSLITAITFIGGVQLLVTGIIGEYIGNIFINIKKRPLYVIKKEI